VPNNAARTLKSKRNKILCLAYPESDNPFFFILIDTVEKQAKQAGYALMVYHTHGEISEELRILSLVKEKIVDGQRRFRFPAR
jgi:DNA-binding LacI/PurR family transcriptional regulator